MGNPDDITYRLDAGELARFDLQASTWWAAGWSTRGEQLTYPGRHGNAAPAKPAVWDPQPLQLDMLLRKPTQVELQAVMTELTGLVAAGGVRTLTRMSAGEETVQPCRVVSFQPGEFLVGSHAQVSLTVELMGPFWRALSAVDRFLPAGTSTLPREGTAPITDALVRFAGPSSGAHTVTEGVWGTGITWTGSLVSGQHVFVDPRAMRAWQGASGDWGRPSTVKDVSTGLSPATAGPLALHLTSGWGQGAVTRTNYAHDPFLEHTAVVSTPSGMRAAVATARVVDRGGERWLEVVSTYASNNGYVEFGSTPLHAPGVTVHLSAEVDISEAAWAAGDPPSLTIIYKPTENSSLVSQSASAPGPGRHRLSLTVPMPSTASEFYYRLYRRAKLGDPPVYYRDISLSGAPGPVFSGDTPDTDELAYEWTGTPGQSASTAGPRVLVRNTPLTASRAATIRFKEAWL